MLKEAMTPQAVPSAKPDALKAALVKMAMQPPLPVLRPQPALEALAALPPASARRRSNWPHRRSYGAYQAAMEPDMDTARKAVSEIAARKQTSPGDEAQRGVPVAVTRAEDGGAARPAPLSWPAFVSPRVSVVQKAPADNVVPGRMTGQPSDAASGGSQTRHGRYRASFGCDGAAGCRAHCICLAGHSLKPTCRLR
ncbi:hypothetical protein FJ945_08030 [Mesorhizobium sp. B2-4-9]|uniref:hypothetical protein n=1 Tax=Mesorhizobium sp. B2-4-5 TaxID=2589944 RepID=UPI00112CBB17|nr:hypothetical protein [Mesorhizobium sp. B2-4-5]TPK56472.1 hypothetical protein FJ550_01205 [Mesorhizobium sp. B2-5-2]TPL28329.1 hypothetical protein FJ945_08030 [Mesorhizobium sp. B2-4-9]TPM74344.1 hypothetical protein FJ968_14480 [Mesorhizobium sp. B2-1-6]